MRIVFLATSAADLAWFRTYYRKVFPEGASRAKAQYRKTMTLLSSNLFIGHPIAESGEREYSIPRTPFSVIYRIEADRIEILRFWDQRAEPSGRDPGYKGPADA